MRHKGTFGDNRNVSCLKFGHGSMGVQSSSLKCIIRMGTFHSM